MGVPVGGDVDVPKGPAADELPLLPAARHGRRVVSGGRHSPGRKGQRVDIDRAAVGGHLLRRGLNGVSRRHGCRRELRR